MSSNYGTVLDFNGGGKGECPPDGLYTYLIAEVSEVEEKPNNFSPEDTDIQIFLTTKLEGYEAEDDDEDETDWNGTSVRQYIVLGRRSGKDPEAEPYAVWKSPKNQNYAVMKAIFPEWDWSEETAGYKKQPVDLNAFIGRRFRAMTTPNAKGYPKLSGHIPAKKLKSKAPAPVIVDTDEDDDLMSAE